MSENAIRLFVVMGVSGCGKSSIGEALAKAFDATYFEGDSLHPSANIELMSKGIPLTDKDRWPWLEQIAQAMAAQDGLVFTGCSALRKSYRSFLIEKAQEPIFFIHLAGSKDLIASRMREREGHFMSLGLLESQFATLEPPDTSETALTVDISASKDQILETIVSVIGRDSRVAVEIPE
ncbi:MAG: gluconokinase [Pseudomonadota bacterium]